MSGHSHHFVLSSVEDASSTEEPLFECAPFRATLTGAPLTVTQKADEEIVLPEGVGYALGANQLMHLELHYINTSSHTEDVSAQADLFPLTDTESIQEAGFLVVGNLDIKIPPKSKHSTGELFIAAPPDLEQVHYYAVTGHTHKLGTHVTVGIAPSAQGETTSIYAPTDFDWGAPTVQYRRPSVQVPAGGGFRFKCDWDNQTDQTVTFGESALTEMCFFWAYYYPRQTDQKVLLYALDKSIYADAGSAGSGQ